MQINTPKVYNIMHPNPPIYCSLYTPPISNKFVDIIPKELLTFGETLMKLYYENDIW